MTVGSRSANFCGAARIGQAGKGDATCPLQKFKSAWHVNLSLTSRNDIPFKARWTICTKENKIVSGIMIADAIFYPKPDHRRMQYKEEIDKDKVIDDYLELRFDYQSVYAEEMGSPKSLLGKVVKKYRMLEDPQHLMEFNE